MLPRLSARQSPGDQYLSTPGYSACPTESGFVFFRHANRDHRDGQRRRRFGAGVVTGRAPYLPRGTQSSGPEGPCSDSGRTQITAHSPAEAVNDAETVLFAIPPDAIRQVIDNLEDLKGKVLIDATNSVRARRGSLRVLRMLFAHGPRARTW